MIHNIEPVGTAAIDFDAVDTGGNSVRLSDLWQSKPLVVVFLRHLGCTFCRTHVLELRRQYQAFRALGAEVVCVAMGSANVGKAFKIVFDAPFPILMTGDDGTSIYAKYGLNKGTLAQLLGSDSWLKGFAAIFKLGWRIVGRISGEGTQLSGTFIIDRAGTIRLAYRSRNASDNPSNELLLSALSELQQGEPQLENLSSSAIPEPAGQL